MPAPANQPTTSRVPGAFRMRTFLQVYVACAILFQLGGATPAWGPSSLIEASCAGLFVMLAVVCLALMRRASGYSRVFWLGSCIALVLLGLDEFFELHESLAVEFLSQTDHLKVLLWVGAGAALALVHWIERPSRSAQWAMLVGFAVHTLYLLVEVGDGGYYQLPLSAGVTRLIEEVFELLMLSAYLFAFGSIEAESRECELAIPDEPPDAPRLDRAA